MKRAGAVVEHAGGCRNFVEVAMERRRLPVLHHSVAGGYIRRWVLLWSARLATPDPAMDSSSGSRACLEIKAEQRLGGAMQGEEGVALTYLRAERNRSEGWQPD